MKLTTQQIKEISFGAARIIENKNGLEFHKCTEKQIEVLKAERPDIVVNATNATGCRMDFHTNSDYFKFSAKAGNKYELYINDVFVKQFLFGTIGGCGEAVLPEGENRVTLVFPSHDAAATITSVELSSGSTVIPHSYALKMAFFGDSITQGWESGYDSLSYAWRVARFFDADIWNPGVGGNVLLENFVDFRPDFIPDVVIVSLGTNDWSTWETLEELENHTTEFLKRVCEGNKNARIFVISPIWRAEEFAFRPMGAFAECCNTVKKAAAEFPVTLIDGYTLTPHINDFYTDGLHPNGLGFGIYAENLIKVLSKAL